MTDLSDKITSAEELEALAFLCETELDSRRLDCQIAFAVLGDMQVSVKGPMRAPIPYMLSDAIQHPSDLQRIALDNEIDMVPRYTSSIDVALSLVPEKYAQCWRVEYSSAELRYYGDNHEAGGRTPALALCAVALRAIAKSTP